MTRQQILRAFYADLAKGTLTWRAVSKYHSRLNGKEAGGPRPTHIGKQYWVIRWDKYSYKRAHLIYFLVHGKWPKPCVDHINGDSLDDRPSNLRAATVTQNAWNHHKRKRRIKLPMGVRINKPSGSFSARISYRKRQIHIGVFDTPEMAHGAYLEKRKELYGQFA